MRVYAFISGARMGDVTEPEEPNPSPRSPARSSPPVQRKFLGVFRVSPDGDLDDLVEAIYEAAVASIREEECRASGREDAGPLL
jgi:hypothetical protein